jgi:hypothetical protein
MKGSRSILFDAKEIKQIPDVFVDESRVSIVYNLSRKSMIAKDSVSKGLCKSFCSELDMGGFKLDIFGEAIDNDKNGVVPI